MINHEPPFKGFIEPYSKEEVIELVSEWIKKETITKFTAPGMCYTDDMTIKSFEGFIKLK